MATSAASATKTDGQTDDDFTQDLRAKLGKCAKISVLLIFQQIDILFLLLLLMYYKITVGVFR